MPVVTPVGYVYGDDGTYRTSSGALIPANTMRFFRDPLLFVDDRNVERTVALRDINSYTLVNTSVTATLKTAFVTDSSGTTKSMQQAVAAGWLDQYLYEQHADGLFYYYPSKLNLDEYLVQKNTFYLLLSKKSGLILHYFEPGNHYLDARARQDMVALSQTNTAFYAQAYRATFGVNLAWSPPYAVNWMLFTISTPQIATWLNQAYNTNNPLERYVAAYNPATGQWGAWIQVY